MGSSQTFRLWVGPLEARGGLGTSPGPPLRTPGHGAHTVSACTSFPLSLPFRLAPPLLRSTSVFLSLASTSFCPLPPAATWVSAPGPSAFPALCLLRACSPLLAAVCPVEPYLGPGSLCLAAAADRPEPGRPRGGCTSSSGSCRATWEGRGIRTREKGAHSWG